MALPFPNDDRGKRKWQCFVCGLQFKDYEAFKGHILEDHEEGRHYILCPLSRCRAPIRDLRSHFRAKHPKEKVPKGKQMKATIWKDIKSGKVRTQKPRFIEGDFPSRKAGKEIHYRSSYERQVYDLLEQLPEIVTYDTEKVEIPYYYKGKQRKYKPDLCIIYTDQSIEIWEIKPANQTDLPMNQAKWAAAKKYCLLRGWKFQVMTEVGINKLKNYVLNERRTQI